MNSNMADSSEERQSRSRFRVKRRSRDSSRNDVPERLDAWWTEHLKSTSSSTIKRSDSLPPLTWTEYAQGERWPFKPPTNPAVKVKPQSRPLVTKAKASTGDAWPAPITGSLTPIQETDEAGLPEQSRVASPIPPLEREAWKHDNSMPEQSVEAPSTPLLGQEEWETESESSHSTTSAPPTPKRGQGWWNESALPEPIALASPGPSLDQDETEYRERLDERDNRNQRRDKRAMAQPGSSAADAHTLNWAQIGRVAEHCRYWYDASDLKSVIKYDVQKEMIKYELWAIQWEIFRNHFHKKERFVRILADEVLDKLEGPRGLGRTKKGEFMRAVRHALYRINAEAGDVMRAFYFFDNLNPSEDDKEPEQKMPPVGMSNLKMPASTQEIGGCESS